MILHDNFTNDEEGALAYELDNFVGGEDEFLEERYEDLYTEELGCTCGLDPDCPH